MNGAQAHGWSAYYDFGSADGCPQSGSSDGPCNNGWRVSDVGYVSFHGLALPLPEIYYPANANQWTVVRKWWNANQGGYVFAGATATTGAGLAPASGVERAQRVERRSRRPGARVLRLLTCLGAVGLLAAGSGFAVAAARQPGSPSRIGAASDSGPDARPRRPGSDPAGAPTGAERLARQRRQDARRGLRGRSGERPVRWSRS